ncbi:ABC transporter ATP-binding protein [Pilimelia terevasa]|nr:ABC transporter ATP-binding protein [Pilimelia terevasa]
MEITVRGTGLTKTYGSGDATVTALAGVDVAISRGEFCAVMGPSGSGKSTLMHCLAGLDTPSGGEVHIGGTSLAGLRDDALTALRRDRVGFVFQAFNLLPTLTAAENITLPLDLAGRRPDPRHFDTIVDAVGLRDRLGHRPSQLSGGQQQRVACARALITRPAVVFADEPTGALDSRASGEVLDLLRRSVDELGQTVVMVTHEPSAAAYADRVLFLADGRLVAARTGASAEDILDALKSLDGVPC